MSKDRSRLTLKIFEKKNELIKSQQQALKKMRDALEFYGEDNNWRTRQGGHIGNKNLKANVCNDLGELARATLNHDDVKAVIKC